MPAKQPELGSEPETAPEGMVIGTTFERDGFVWKVINGFDGPEEVAVGLAGDVDLAVQDDGNMIDWGVSPWLEGSFVGTYCGSKIVQGKNEQTGEPEDIALYLLEDTSGQRYCTWGTYQLTEAFAKASPGARIHIQHLGRRKVPGRSDMHAFKVFVGRT